MCFIDRDFCLKLIKLCYFICKIGMCCIIDYEEFFIVCLNWVVLRIVIIGFYYLNRLLVFLFM